MINQKVVQQDIRHAFAAAKRSAGKRSAAPKPGWRRRVKRNTADCVPERRYDEEEENETEEDDEEEEDDDDENADRDRNIVCVMR